MFGCEVMILLKDMPVDQILLYIYTHTYIHIYVYIFFLLVTVKTCLMLTVLRSLHFKKYFEMYYWKQNWSSDSIPLWDVCMLHIQCIQIDIEHKISFIV